MPEVRRVRGVMNMGSDKQLNAIIENPVKLYTEMVTKQLLQQAEDLARLKRKVRALIMLMEAERVPQEIIQHRLMAREDTIRRAKEQFELDYADSSDGTLPFGNRIGRRYLLPQDFGRKSWDFEKPDERSPDHSPETIEAETKKLGRQQIFEYKMVNEEAFFIIHGFKYKPLDGEAKLQSLTHTWAGVRIPPTSILFTNARIVGGYYTVNLEVPPVLTPRMLLDLTAFFNDLGPHKYQLGIFGEVVAQTRYIIREPQDLLVR